LINKKDWQRLSDYDKVYCISYVMNKWKLEDQYNKNNLDKINQMINYLILERTIEHDKNNLNTNTNTKNTFSTRSE
jgi:hypothetical protein